MPQTKIDDTQIQNSGITTGTYNGITYDVEGFATATPGPFPVVAGSVQAPASVVYDHANYSGTTEYVTWRANNTTAYGSGAIEFYGWQDSPDGTTWNTETFHGDTYQGSALTSGSQYARAHSYPLTTNGTSPVASGWVVSNAQVYTTGPQKRRLSIVIYPNSTTVDTGPNLNQTARLPHGTNGVSSQWKVTNAYLRTESPNANATTVQLYYSSAPSNAAFGAGTTVFTNPLSLTSASNYEVSTTAFTGSLASVGIPSGSIFAAAYTAQGAPACLVIEMEEV